MKIFKRKKFHDTSQLTSFLNLNLAPKIAVSVPFRLTRICVLRSVRVSGARARVGPENVLKYFIYLNSKFMIQLY